MAYLSKIQLYGTTYSLKDEEVRKEVANLATSVASPLTFKGVVSQASDLTSIVDYKAGWTYKSSANFEIAGLGKIENGDMVICIEDYADEFSAAHWTVLQNNVDEMTGASAEVAGTKGLVPAPGAGKQDSFLRGDGVWSKININDFQQNEADVLILNCGDAYGNLLE